MYFNEDISHKSSFNLVASAYDVSRPSYPQEIYLDALSAMGYRGGNQSKKVKRVLEIGSGSGQATIDLSLFANHLDCIEPGETFCKMLKKKFSNNSNIKINESEFENFVVNEKYDMVVSACALHWIPREVAYSKIKSLLKPNGWLLGIWNQPQLPAEIYSCINETICQKIPSFQIPQYKTENIELFTQGFNDLSTNRGFIDCYMKVYSVTRTLSMGDLVSLIWSYVNIEKLSEKEQMVLLGKLEDGLKCCGTNTITYIDQYPVAMGKCLI